MRHGHPQFYQLLEEIAELHSKKNHDYAKTDDPLSNFRMCEAFGISAWKGTLVRMSDKWSRIQQLSNGKTAQNESLRDSLIDLAVYALLDIILLEEATTKSNSRPSASPANAADAACSPPILAPGLCVGTVPEAWFEHDP